MTSNAKLLKYCCYFLLYALLFVYQKSSTLSILTHLPFSFMKNWGWFCLPAFHRKYSLFLDEHLWLLFSFPYSTTALHLTESSGGIFLQHSGQVCLTEVSRYVFCLLVCFFGFVCVCVCVCFFLKEEGSKRLSEANPDFVVLGPLCSALQQLPNSRQTCVKSITDCVLYCLLSSCYFCRKQLHSR